jgi:hypothetical protein
LSIKSILIKIKPPQFWIDFARGYGISEVMFIKGDGPHKSMIIGDVVVISLNCTGVGGYRKILDVSSYEEVIVVKFLHEIAHYVKKHYSRKMKQGKIIALEDVCARTLEEILSDPCEREAWDFVLEFKEKKPELFQALVESFRAHLG